jgi:hypothetical protein
MSLVSLVFALRVLVGAGSPWYEGIDTITVITPGDADAQERVNSIFQQMEQDAHGNATAFQKGQFGIKRQAILLRSGDHGSLTVPVNWYTSVAGVGMRPDDVKIQSFVSKDAYLDSLWPGSPKGSLENFWKSVEGVTTKTDTLWAVSQAAPLRRSIIGGDLVLSCSDHLCGKNGTHYTSGGFLADVAVNGVLHWGSQQQFFFRNSLLHEINYTTSGQSFVFVGAEGAPVYNSSKVKPLISSVERAPIVAEKPYLVELNGEWFIAVPDLVVEARGTAQHEQSILIPISEAFVAKAGDSSEVIQAGIQGKRALVLTPALYGLTSPIYISNPDFVVLGIGMPTLVVTGGLSAIIVGPQAAGVRVAHVLLEAGTPLEFPDATEPLLFWRGTNGIASDVFARVGAFSYEAEFHESCRVTKADIHARFDGDGIVMDNLWLWHADHDDCTKPFGKDPKSDACYSETGLVVNGNNAVGYGLAVEHTKADLVRWEGENGKLFFFQSELPYRSNPDFGIQGHVGFGVGYGVQSFHGYGIGIYQVFNLYSMKVSFRLPPTANMTNMFSWCITGNRSGLGSLVCTSPGLTHCQEGSCDKSSCQELQWSGVNATAARKQRPKESTEPFLVQI